MYPLWLPIKLRIKSKVHFQRPPVFLFLPTPLEVCWLLCLKHIKLFSAKGLCKCPSLCLECPLSTSQTLGRVCLCASHLSYSITLIDAPHLPLPTPTQDHSLSFYHFTSLGHSSPLDLLTQVLARWLIGKESPCQCKKCGFDPWVRMTLWRRNWQATLVLLPGKSQEQRILVGYSPWGCRIGHNGVCSSAKGAAFRQTASVAVLGGHNQLSCCWIHP